YSNTDPVASTFATASMVTFAVMTTNLFQYGVGVAEDRQQPWDPFTRSLPAGPLPRFLGRILAGVVLMTISLVPVVVIAALFTAATISLIGFFVALAATIVIAIPFTLMGLAIGYSLPAKAAIVVAQVLFIPLAFGGGLMTPPGAAPGFVETIAPYLPSGAAARLMWAAAVDFPINASSVAALVGWTIGFAALAVWAYRRDEGRRFS
ncbi:ABC transporter permease, partial [Actinoplanes sp. NPDC051633]|uniref:ABC transporter permease n=1 Tax=Actinoplanes sp. NPDC051633 TaxID=3155670 RepID=UPI003431F5D9